jgi:hypothetical protein
MKVEVEILRDGSRRLMHRQLAKVLVKKGLVRIVEQSAQVAAPAAYETRMLQAAPSEAPYGYKADGTPRLRPGHPVKEA